MIGGELVVALPGSSTWNRGWSPKFKDKRVVIVPDHDAAGEKCAEAIAGDLINFASEVLIYKWGESK
ncbi:MAG: DNA primase [Pseudoalteromonas tetraodonis]